MYRDILLAVDMNEDSSWRRALPTAVEYCRAFQSTLHVVTIAPDFSMPFVGQFFPADYARNVADALLATLHSFVRKHVPDDVRVQHIVSEGTVYQEILRVADDIGADLIVMASHRPALKDYLLGPNAARVVRHAACSVLVVRG
ncbi:MAG: universal stress protein [Rhodospirillales bacterium]|nr:universal stress protein [Rhodospirillales bacterium]